MPTVTTIHYGTPEHAALVDSLTPPSAPELPEPWPGMAVRHADSNLPRAFVRRSVVADVVEPDGAFAWTVIDSARREIQWTPDVVREVRAADGAVLWVRPVAKVTT